MFSEEPAYMLEPAGHPGDDDVAVLARNLGKMYHLNAGPLALLKKDFLGVKKRLYREFWALRDVSFEVRRDETLGIIGRNGAGKSTLLQILAGTLAPTTGEVQVKGRVAALLELGSGFNPEFTGRENVYLNGAVLGFSRQEIAKRFDEIAAFADIGSFLEQPVKLYSSGMAVRLAFAVQACADPDVLIVDEALAVGDIGFQRKCYRHIETLKKEHGTSIILVTHDTNAIVNFCDKAVFLHEGGIVYLGEPKLAAELYYKQIFGEDVEVKTTEVYGSGDASIREAWFEDAGGNKITSIGVGDPFSFCYYVDFHREANNPIFGMRATTIQGQPLISTNTFMLGEETGHFQNGVRVKVRWQINNVFNRGFYFFSCGCMYNDDDRFLCRRLDTLKLAVVGSSKETGVLTSVCRVDIRFE
jgi:ABC-type polysaccharide/polyol phosphate transport system ATPase subunit